MNDLTEREKITQSKKHQKTTNGKAQQQQQQKNSKIVNLSYL